MSRPFPAALAGALLALLAAGAAIAAEPPPPRPEAVRPYLGPQHRVEVAKGRRLNLVCMGQGGPTVLFEAGGSDWSAIWALVQPAVGRGTTACAYDRAGLGYSDPAAAPRSPIAVVEDLHALVSAAGLARPLVLVGHSLGGFDAKLYATLYPEDIAGLVLLDPAEDRTWDRTRALANARFGARTAAKAELLDQRFLARLVDHFQSCGTAAREAGLDPASDLYRRCTDPVRPRLGPEIAAARVEVQKSAAYQAAQASEFAASVYADHSGDAAYARLFKPGVLGERPVVVLTHVEEPSDDPLDALDQAQGLALHRATAALSRRGVHRTVPNSSHNIEIDAPEVVIAAVQEVVGRVRAKPRGRRR
ncbi:alpha/beta fold hydrolase [Phenylobacterium soli]|nr:alpha/beta hydrolase [Phenylobacterium soli]